MSKKPRQLKGSPWFFSFGAPEAQRTEACIKRMQRQMMVDSALSRGVFHENMLRSSLRCSVESMQRDVRILCGVLGVGVAGRGGSVAGGSGLSGYSTPAKLFRPSRGVVELEEYSPAVRPMVDSMLRFANFQLAKSDLSAEDRAYCEYIAGECRHFLDSSDVV